MVTVFVVLGILPACDVYHNKANAVIPKDHISATQS